MDIKQTVRIGLFYLEDAILEVLKGADKPLTTTDIALELGIRFLRYGPRIVEGLLHKLLAAERVEDVEVGSTKAWQISKTPPPYTL